MADAPVRSLPPAPRTAWLEAAPPLTRLAFYADAQARAAAAAVWMPGFPEQACRASTLEGRAALWMGPDEYLLMAGAGMSADLAAALGRALGDLPHALVDISHRQFGIEIRGPHAEDILRGACPLDLDVGRFPVNMCTRTVLAKADIVLWRTREDAFHVEIWRSFAGYVIGLLGEIAAEFPTEEPM